MAKPHSLKFLPGIARIILAAPVAVNRGKYGVWLFALNSLKFSEREPFFGNRSLARGTWIKH